MMSSKYNVTLVTIYFHDPFREEKEQLICALSRLWCFSVLYRTSLMTYKTDFDNVIKGVFCCNQTLRGGMELILLKRTNTSHRSGYFSNQLKYGQP